MLDETSQYSPCPDVEFLRIGIEKYCHKFIGQKIFRDISIQGLHPHIGIYHGRRIVSECIKGLCVFDLVEIEVRVWAVHEVENQAIRVRGIGYEIRTIGIYRFHSENAFIVIYIIVFEDVLRQNIIKKEDQIVFAG